MTSRRKEKALAATIRAAGFRATKPRLRVLAQLQKSPRPLTIKEIIAAIGKTKIDQVTVYRILDAFKKKGVVVQVDFQHGHAHFELRDTVDDHHHIVCISCGKVEDFVGSEFEDIARKALKQTKKFSKVTDHSLELFGMCNACIKHKTIV